MRTYRFAITYRDLNGLVPTSILDVNAGNPNSAFTKAATMAAKQLPSAWQIHSVVRIEND